MGVMVSVVPVQSQIGKLLPPVSTFPVDLQLKKLKYDRPNVKENGRNGKNVLTMYDGMLHLRSLNVDD